MIQVTVKILQQQSSCSCQGNCTCKLDSNQIVGHLSSSAPANPSLIKNTQKENRVIIPTKEGTVVRYQKKEEIVDVTPKELYYLKYRKTLCKSSPVIKPPTPTAFNSQNIYKPTPTSTNSLPPKAPITIPSTKIPTSPVPNVTKSSTNTPPTSIVVPTNPSSTNPIDNKPALPNPSTPSTHENI